jgi:N-acetylglucosaminyldiphosphoundecaprenol N-acetyl-beta-D-mannosaminyltransferase
MKNTYKQGKLLQLSLFGKRKSDLLIILKKWLQVVSNDKRMRVIFTPNAEQAVQAYEDESFRELLSQADLLLPDGSGVVLASRWFPVVGQQPLREWIPGVDVAKHLFELAATNDSQVAVIGGRGYQEFSEGSFAWHEGYQDISNPTSNEQRAVEAFIRKVKPAILLVAFGAPHQERWVVKNRQLLEQVGVKVVMVVGGALDMLSGKLPRAPQWLRSLGLEWAFRLYQEPWRWKRQLRLVKFAWLVVSGRVRLVAC